jgi:hypothetical protein
MGEENAGADRAKKQHHTCLDHRTGPFVPRRDKTARPAEQSKEIEEWQLIHLATGDFQQHRMSERWRAPG